MGKKMTVLLNQWQQPGSDGDNAFIFGGTMELVGDAGAVSKDEIIAAVQGFDGGGKPVRVTAGSGGNIPMLIGDVNGIVYCTNGSAVTFTALASVANNIPVGSTVTVVQFASGPITYAVTSPDVFYTSDGSSSINSQYSSVIYTLQANGVWLINVGYYGSVYANASFSFSGPWSSNQVTNVYFQKIGRVATMTWNNLLFPINGATNTTAIVNVTAIPSAFYPINTVIGSSHVNLGTAGRANGIFGINNFGAIEIDSNVNATNTWAGTTGITNVGVYGGSLSWITN